MSQVPKRVQTSDYSEGTKQKRTWHRMCSKFGTDFVRDYYNDFSPAYKANLELSYPGKKKKKSRLVSLGSSSYDHMHEHYKKEV